MTLYKALIFCVIAMAVVINASQDQVTDLIPAVNETIHQQMILNMSKCPIVNEDLCQIDDHGTFSLMWKKYLEKKFPAYSWFVGLIFIASKNDARNLDFDFYMPESTSTVSNIIKYINAINPRLLNARRMIFVAWCKENKESEQTLNDLEVQLKNITTDQCNEYLQNVPGSGPKFSATDAYYFFENKIALFKQVTGALVANKERKDIHAIMDGYSQPVPPCARWIQDICGKGKYDVFVVINGKD